jgi:integration host factor subunit beta
MNKRELISELKKRSSITKTEASGTVKVFFDSISEAFIKAERVEIRGFCSFYSKEYKSYIGRNPKTGQKLTILPKRLPFFKCGKELREKVDY